MKKKKRIGILTGGGDCPGINAVIRAVVKEWIGYGARGQTTADLPPWPRAHEPPSATGFEFDPEPWVDRETYLDLRARAEPMFCYIQGLESLACLLARDGRLEKIGVQAFAG